MVRASTEKYLSRYAVPGARLADSVKPSYARVLVVPACDEHLGFVDGYRAAFDAAAGKTLCIVVVNASEAASPAVHEQNERLLCALTRGGTPLADGASLVRGGSFDLLVIDRASVGSRLGRRQGVGHARRIGCDLALRLHARGQVRSPWLYCSDADATLPPDYFAKQGDGALLLNPFQHEHAGDSEVFYATQLYEVFLRYYVLGLGHAGSPYAFHTVGSTLVPHADAYAQARGFPMREAGEDFHLVNKLAKLGGVRRLAGEPIRLRARSSARVPFGTGRGVERIARLGLVLYAPGCFDGLAAWLSAIERFVETGSMERALLELRVAGLEQVLGAFAEEVKLGDALANAARQSPDQTRLRRRLHTWFDALRSLKLIHRIRDAALPSLDWQEAIRAAEFCPDPQPLAQLSNSLLARERQLPSVLGPAVASLA